MVLEEAAKMELGVTQVVPPASAAVVQLDAYRKSRPRRGKKNPNPAA